MWLKGLTYVELEYIEEESEWGRNNIWRDNSKNFTKWWELLIDSGNLENPK